MGFFDFAAYVGIVSKECKRFKITSITDAQFRCLIFVCGLRSACDVDIGSRALSKTEQNPEITLKQVLMKCQLLVNLKHDSTMIQRSVPSAAVNTVQTPQSHIISFDGQETTIYLLEMQQLAFYSVSSI